MFALRVYLLQKLRGDITSVRAYYAQGIPDKYFYFELHFAITFRPFFIFFILIRAIFLYLRVVFEVLAETLDAQEVRTFGDFLFTLNS